MEQQAFIGNHFFSARTRKLRILISFFSLLLTTGLHAQVSILDKEVELAGQAAPIEDVLKTLASKGNFTFTYGSGNLPLKRRVYLPPKKQTVKSFLDEIFEGDSIRYIEKNNKILLVPAKTKPNKGKPKQTLRGSVIDGETGEPLVGVTVKIILNDSIFGMTTDRNGTFRFERLPVGRYSVQFSYVGYETINYSNVLVGSGKEKILPVKLSMMSTELEEIEVSASYYRDKPLNEAAVVSSKSFSAVETENYPGALMDISRAAVSFPGVVSGNDGQNHIVVRGNSPKGLQWRLEGIEIPNLNHFAEIGSSGGGIGILSNNMLANSEFLTGAFPAEYGNALSGIFDLNIRSGNNEKHEKTFQIGLIGTEFMAEGPVNKSKNSSYAAQYRYSTFELITKIIPDIPNLPEFHDLSFKIDLPSQSAGKFSIFGIGGLSRELGADTDYDWRSNMSTVGIKHDYQLDPKTSIKSILAYSGWMYSWEELSFAPNGVSSIDEQWNTKVVEHTLRSSVSITRRLNSNHKLKAGITFDNTIFDSFMQWHSDSLYARSTDPSHPYYSEGIRYNRTNSDAEGTAATGQSFLNWRYAVTNTLTINSGIHFLQFYLNNNYSFEPRLGISWQMLPKHTLNFGFGVHSRKESLSLYTGNQEIRGRIIQSNKDLELTKSRHYVLGYNYVISDNLFLKIEGYYQDLYDIPVYPYPNYFSIINMDYGFEGAGLLNEGTGINKGIELLLEKFFSNGYYFMLNGSLYDSKYKNFLDQEFHTKYNGSYSANAVLLKEFSVGKNKQNLFSINSRYLLAGGLRQYPIDLDRSIENGYEYWIMDEGYSYKLSDFFRMDLQLSFKRNKPGKSSEWRLDLLNVTNRKNMGEIKFDRSSDSIVTEYQNKLIGMLAYRVMF